MGLTPVKRIDLYTDGACSHNSSWKGGWGYVVVVDEQKVYSDAGIVEDTTNNRMELQAVIEGLSALKNGRIGYTADEVLVLSDSAYVVNCFLQKWYEKWEGNGWKNAQKKPVENKDLWMELLSLTRSITGVVFVKVRGHDGHRWNEEADCLAVRGL